MPARLPTLSRLPRQRKFLQDTEQALRSALPAVIFIDLDGFKTFNDSRGHEAGNACLADVVSCVARVLGDLGRLYRYGGDEFAVLLEQADRSFVASLAESIREAIEAGKPGGGDPRVTASIGAACQATVRAPDAAALIQEADEAVYVSKLVRGKNAVTVTPIAEEDRAMAHGKREAERFTAANRGLMLRVHENSEALRQICLHTDRLHQIWVRAATAYAANAAVVQILDQEHALRQSKSLYDDVLTTLAMVFDGEKRATSGGEYDEANPAYHARWYVQDAVWKFVEDQDFRMLANRIGAFDRSSKARSGELVTLGQACERLGTQVEALRHAGSAETVGSSDSLATFLDSIMRIEELATTVSRLTAQLVPDLRSVPAVTAAET